MEFRFHADYRYWEICTAALLAKSEAERQSIWSHWDFAGRGDPKMKGEPQCGYYKRRMYGRWMPVHISKDGGELYCRVSRGRTTPLADTRIWDYCEPIIYSDYVYAFENGRFPGEIDEKPVIYDHNAQDSGAAYRDELTDMLGRIMQFMAKLPSPLTEDNANALANYLAMIRLAEKTAREICQNEIADARKQIVDQRAIWSVSIDNLVSTSKSIVNLITPWLKMQKADGRELKIGGQEGRRVSLRGRWMARVDDWPTVYAEFEDHPRVRELIEQLLDANARSKHRDELIVPGATYYQDDKAV